MAGMNAAEAYARKVEALHRKLAGRIELRAMQLGEVFLGEAVKRTPADQGDLREKWALAPLEKKDNRYIIRIANPAEYAAYVEFGYAQRAGMILKMKDDKGRLRFVQFLGYAKAYRLGAPSGKKKPDKHGFVTIVTRKRFIEGKFMARGALEQVQGKEWPRLKTYLMEELKEIWRGAK